MTDPDFLWKLLAALSLIGNLILLWRKIGGGAEKRQISPDPLNVREADRFVTEKEILPIQRHLETHDKDVERLGKEIQANYNTLMKTDAEGRSRLHHEINAVASDVSAIKSTIGPLSNQMTDMTRALGRVEGILQQHN
jgi:hypothetical protein